MHSIQARLRPCSHLFVCERLRFTTTTHTFAPPTRAATLLNQAPAVLIVNIDKDSRCSGDIADLQRVAAEALVPKSLLVLMDGGLHPPGGDHDLQCRVGTSGPQWMVLHTGQLFRVLELTATQVCTLHSLAVVGWQGLTARTLQTWGVELVAVGCGRHIAGQCRGDDRRKVVSAWPCMATYARIFRNLVDAGTVLTELGVFIPAVQ